MRTAYQFPDAEPVQELTVGRFAGVDFANHPTKVDWSRSPDACNMIANETYFPVKRTGYKQRARFDGKIYGLHRLKDAILCHAGNKLWRLNPDTTTTLLYQDMNEATSTSFLMGGKLWLLDGKTYLVYDDEAIQRVQDIAFIPTTTIGSPPQGGGTSLEAVNMLTPWRINTFVGDGKSTEFHLDSRMIDLGSVQCAEYDIQSVNTVTGVVTFQTAPPDAGGLANVVIQFAKTGNHADINKCRICGLYGGQNDTRVFVSGNPEMPNCDWQSGLYDPSYFPDTGYTKIGSDASAIMGYARQYDTQIVLKEDGQDAKQYLRTFQLDDNEKPTYPLRQGAEAAGAVNPYTIDVLDGTPYYLSPQGIMGIYGTYVTEYRTIAGVSQRINPKLLREQLEHAAACVWDEKYYLAVGGHCYVADSRQMENNIPEWYYWDNIPAVCFLADTDTNGYLWFGTEDGRVCTFSHTDDVDAYSDDGRAISARWVTPLSALDAWDRSKTILSCQPALMPYGYSGADIWYRTERMQEKVQTVAFSQFSFAHMDFSRFSFRSTAASYPADVRRRIRRAYQFQLIVRNDNEGEPFGLLGLTIRYIVRKGVRQI
ncbi:MAG: hypothetical protein Q4C40_07130 [Eubacteriales bacterium]|nr:hypothetical protein [Eubacteriales bacterium]